MRPNTIQAWLFSGAVGLALTALSGTAFAQGLYGVPTHWQADSGRLFELRQQQGHWTVLTMAYGACRRICSTSLRVMEDVQAEADRKGMALDFIVIGLDPAQDKPADWAALRKQRKLDRPNWAFLSGDEAATRAFAQRLGVHYWKYGEHTMHDFRIVLISAEGEVVRRFETFDSPLSLLLP